MRARKMLVLGLKEDSLGMPMTTRSFAIRIIFVTLLSGCSMLEQSNVLHNLYLIICKPTPEQQAVAQQNVQKFFSSAKKSGRPPLKSRYIAVQTLNPVVKQKLVYVSKKTKARIEAEKNGQKLPASWVDTDQLRCLMVFDTKSKQFVGSGCYVVGSLPNDGQLAQFESETAEFVSTPQAPY
jgi:hypothetical protein